MYQEVHTLVKMNYHCNYYIATCIAVQKMVKQGSLIKLKKLGMGGNN